MEKARTAYPLRASIATTDTAANTPPVSTATVWSVSPPPTRSAVTARTPWNLSHRTTALVVSTTVRFVANTVTTSVDVSADIAMDRTTSARKTTVSSCSGGKTANTGNPLVASDPFRRYPRGRRRRRCVGRTASSHPPGDAIAAGDVLTTSVIMTALTQRSREIAVRNSLTNGADENPPQLRTVQSAIQVFVMRRLIKTKSAAQFPAAAVLCSTMND